MKFIPNKVGIVDDTHKNLEAAEEAVSKILPTADILLFDSAGEILEYINNSCGDLDMLLTDLNMEEPNIGFKVMIEGWSWRIPTIIVTGGFKNHGDHFVKCFPGTFASASAIESIGGEKDRPNTWKNVILSSLDNPLLSALSRGKSAGLGKDVSIGEDISIQLKLLDEIKSFNQQ